MRCFSLAVALCLSVVAGCDTDGPLSDPAASQLDEALLGHWSGVQEDMPLDLFVGRHAVKGNPVSIAEVFGIQWDPKSRRFDSFIDSEGTNPMPRLYASMTTIGSQTFLSVFFSGGNPADLSGDNSYAKWTNDSKRNCLTIRYETDGKRLKFATMTGDDVDAAVKHRELIQKNGFVTAASLVAHIEKTGGQGDFEFQPIQLDKQN